MKRYIEVAVYPRAIAFGIALMFGRAMRPARGLREVRR